MNDPHDPKPSTIECDPDPHGAASSQAGAPPCVGQSNGLETASKITTGRRSFLQWLTYAVGGLAVAVFGAPLVGYFLGTEKRRVDWVKLGPITKFPVNETRTITFDNPLRTSWDGITALTGVFVRYEGKDESQLDRFLVFSVNCAHLGCPVSWFPQSGLFMCPCHGGVYYANGERASGPPPRGLFACPWRVRDGQLEIQAPHYPTLQDPLTKPA